MKKLNLKDDKGLLLLIGVAFLLAMLLRAKQAVPAPLLKEIEP